MAAQSVAIIETVAGTADVGDGGAATAAQLRYPLGVAVDGSGNLYIADRDNERIRKVTASTGIISTVAGGGVFRAGGQAATLAQLPVPRSVAVDGSGNLYIAEGSYILKVTTSGIISTVAGSGRPGYSGDGGPAASAQLSTPFGVAVDGSGNLYIADTGNDRIRKVDASTGNISTVAGVGTNGFSGDGGAATSAQFSAPVGVAVDGSGNLYIADSGGNSRIRKVTVSTGNISTVAGGGASLGDGGAATSARLISPRDVAVDGSGNIYIPTGGRIRKVTASTGNISTVAGTGTGGFSGDGGAATSARLRPNNVAVDGSGNIYISSSSNHRIRKVTASTGNISTVAGSGTAYSGDGAAAASAHLHDPVGVAVDGSGNLYIADRGNERIRKVTASTGNISTVAGGGSSLGDGGAATSAWLNLPNGVAVDGSGNIYIPTGGRIRKVTASTGNISTVAGTGTAGYSGDGGAATSARINSAGVAVDGSGNIYIASTSNNRVRKVDASTGNISTVAGTGTAGSSGDGGAATSARLNNPQGVAVDASGNIYIADRHNNRIRKVDASTGNISTVAGGGSSRGDGGAATAARLLSPWGVAVDGSSNIYIPTFAYIRKVDASTGIISTVAGGGFYNEDGCAAASARLNNPQGVAVDASGNIYIADTTNHSIRKVGPSPPGSTPAPCGAPAPAPVQPTPEPEPGPTVEPVGVSELSFAPAPDTEPGEPMSQALTLRATGDATDFEVLPSARWIEISRWEGAVSWKGRLAAGETITLRVTVNPLGLRPGTHRGYVYIRSGGRPARVRIVLEVPPPTGPDVSESGGVFNAARRSAYGEAGLFGPQFLPAAPGSVVAVQGVNFLAGERIAAESFPLPTSLGGVRVLFDGAAAPLFSVGPRRIEAQLPWDLGREAMEAGGLALAEVVVEATDGESSYPRRFWVGAHGPGVFTVSGSGQGQAAVMFAGTTAPAAPLGFSEGSRPARAGDVLEIYATGLGAVEPPIADGRNSCAPDGDCLADGSNVVLRHTAARPRVWIGAYELAPENIRFSGLAPSMAGVNLVVVKIPPNLSPSAAAELRVGIGGRVSQSGVTIAIE